MKPIHLFFVVCITSFQAILAQTVTIEASPAGTRDGINYISDTKVTLVLFAPQKQNVYVLSELNNWQPNPAFLMKRTPDGNRYWLDISSLKPGQEIAFQYLIDGKITTADPYAEKILDPVFDKSIPNTVYPNLKPYPTGAKGMVSVFQTGQTAYTWKVTNFTRPAQEKLVVYKITLRDFLANHTFKALSDTLSYLKRLNVNTIDLMPVMESEGNDFLGLYPYYYTAIDKAFGTQDDFKAFIDKAHQNGIAVILTLPFQDADLEFPYAKMYFDGTKPTANSPMFNVNAVHPLTYGFDFNHESAATQNFIGRVCEYWIKEFKLDGFDLNAAYGYTQRNWNGNYSAFYNYDAGRAANIKSTMDAIKGFDKNAIISLDFFINPTEMKEIADYGGLIQTNMHAQYNYLERGFESPLEMTRASYKAQKFEQPRVLSWMENAFEERQFDILLKRGNSSGSYNTKNVQTAIERRKLAYTLFFSFPGPVALWFHEEIGHDISPETVGGADKQQPIKWEYAKDPDRLKLYKFVSEMAKLKQNNPAFSTTDYKEVSGLLVQQLTLKHATNNVIFVGNFDVVEQKVKLDMPNTGKWTDYFTGTESWFATSAADLTLKPGEFHLLMNVPDNSTFILSKPEQGLVPWSGQVGPPVLAIESPIAAPNLQVYPNPASDFVYLSLENIYRGAVLVQIKDLLGREIYSESIEKQQERLSQKISLQALPTGLYFLGVEFNEKQIIRKIVVAK